MEGLEKECQICFGVAFRAKDSREQRQIWQKVQQEESIELTEHQ